MKRHEIANGLLRNGFSLSHVSEYDDFLFTKTEFCNGVGDGGGVIVRKEISISWVDGVDKVEARKFINNKAVKVNGETYIIQHDYDLVRIEGNVMKADGGDEFPL